MPAGSQGFGQSNPAGTLSEPPLVGRPPSHTNAEKGLAHYLMKRSKSHSIVTARETDGHARDDQAIEN